MPKKKATNPVIYHQVGFGNALPGSVTAPVCLHKVLQMSLTSRHPPVNVTHLPKQEMGEVSGECHLVGAMSGRQAVSQEVACYHPHRQGER